MLIQKITRFNNQIDAILVAQYCIILALASLTISPPLANLFIALTFLTATLSKEIRTQLILFFHTKLGYTSIAFIILIISGVFYSIANIDTTVAAIWGWRKFLLLPISAAIFMNSAIGKQRLINSFWFICFILVILSFVLFFTDHTHKSQNQPGVIVRNYVTQGIFFSVAIIIGLSNLLSPKSSNLVKALSGISIPFFLCNILLVTTGRSAYVALGIMIISFIWLHYRKLHVRQKTLLMLSFILIFSGLLLSISIPKERIKLAANEFKTSQKVAQETSVGLRVIFLKNTIDMLPNYYRLGTGTGGFEAAYQKQVRGKSGAEGVITGDPHNQYLKILIEHGIFGLTLFLATIVLLLRQKASAQYKTIGLSVILAFACTSLANSHFSTFNEGQFIWILAGSLLASEMKSN